MVTKAGFVGLAGRPNVGKSTLVNQIIGEKVVIVSDRPQTTRRAIRGIAMRGQTQLVMVDLPGFQRPRDLLTERMQRRVERELADSDAAHFVLNGEEGVGAGDRFIAELLKASSKPVLIAVNKGDRLNRSRTMTSLLAAEELGLDAEIFPISAKTGEGVEPLVARLAELARVNGPARRRWRAAARPGAGAAVEAATFRTGPLVAVRTHFGRGAGLGAALHLFAGREAHGRVGA